MKTIKYILILLIFVCLCSCVVVQPNPEWYTGYQLQLKVGKEKAKEIKLQCQANWTKNNRTTRDNMRTGEIEYKVNLDSIK